MSHVDLTNIPKNSRLESDSMGKIPVPSDRYYGAQTARSLIHFNIGKDLMPLEVVHSFGILKKACAMVNQELGKLSPRARHARRQGRRRSHRGQARRPLPAPRLADRQRHAEQHERQRGHLQPRHRDRRRHPRFQVARPSQRPREHVPVLQRYVSRRHVDRRDARDRAHAAARREAAARRPRHQAGTNSPTSSRSAAPT